MNEPHRLAIAGAPILSHDRSRVLARWKSDIIEKETGAHEGRRAFTWVPRLSRERLEHSSPLFPSPLFPSQFAPIADWHTVHRVFNSPVAQVWEFEGRDTPETDEDWNRIFRDPGCFIHADEPQSPFARIAEAAETLLKTTDDNRMNTPYHWREFTMHLRDVNRFRAGS